MRLANNPDDAGYKPHHIARLAKIYLDGVLQVACCTVADEERGYVHRFKKLCVAGLPRKGKLPTERVYGTVVIEWPPGWEGGTSTTDVQPETYVVL
jgi:hypothetical protein